MSETDIEPSHIEIGRKLISVDPDPILNEISENYEILPKVNFFFLTGLWLVSVDKFGFSKTDHNPFRSSSTGQEDKLDGQNRLGLHFERCQNLDDPMHEHSITINRFVYDLVYDSSKNSPELGFDRFFDLILESGPLDRVFQVKNT